MGKGKGYRLEKGFLLDYGWVPSLKRLSGEQFKALVLALLSYQQSEGRETLPDWGEDVMMSCIAEMILPQLRNRLLGAVRQAAGKEENKETAEVKREATPLAAEPPGRLRPRWPASGRRPVLVLHRLLRRRMLRRQAALLPPRAWRGTSRRR